MSDKSSRHHAPSVSTYCVNTPRELWDVPTIFCFTFLNVCHTSHFSFISCFFFFNGSIFFVLCVTHIVKNCKPLLWNHTPFLTMNNSSPGLYHVHQRPRLHGCHKEGEKARGIGYSPSKAHLQGDNLMDVMDSAFSIHNLYGILSKAKCRCIMNAWVKV